MPEEPSPLITVFTPTFNRAHTLNQVYLSLNQQTTRNFEWLVVDDGSTDKTRSLIEKWQSESDFPIQYYFQENQGKHVAHNSALALARGKYFTFLDSDDSCKPNAVLRLIESWQYFAEKEDIAGLLTYCVNPDGDQIGADFPDLESCDLLTLQYRYGQHFERWWCYRTGILKQYPFPQRADMPFVPEGVVWNAIARDFQVALIPEALRIYTPPRSDADAARLSNQSLERSAPGLRYWHLQNLNQNFSLLCGYPLELLRIAFHYSRFSKLLGVGFLRSILQLTNPGARLVATLLWPSASLYVRFSDNRNTPPSPAVEVP